MKRYSFLAFLALGLIAFNSCGQKENPIDENPIDENPIEEEYVELTLRPKGIDMSITPMSTRASSSSDLYIVMVFTTEARSGNQYASWLTDDLSKEKIKLLRGKKYVCQVAYFPNGKEILADYESCSVAPICGGLGSIAPKLSDGILYGSKYGFDTTLSGAAKKKGDKTSGSAADGYYFNDVVRYSGEVAIDAINDITADINLYMQVFGLNLNVVNFTKGHIKVSSPLNYGLGNNDITLTPSSPSISKVLTYDTCPWYDDNDFENYKGMTNFVVDYYDVDGKSITIFELQDYYIARMTRLNLTLDLDEILNNVEAGLTPRVVTGENWNDVTIKY